MTEQKSTVWLDPDEKTLRFGRESAKGTSNGVAIGECYREVDGYLVWVPPERQGSWDAHGLRLVADFLDEANREWDETLRRWIEEDMGKLE